METLNVKDNYGFEIENIWGDPKYLENDVTKPLIERGFTVQEEMKKNALLFIGINPSYSEHYTKYYNEPENAYFLKFIEISKNVGHEWTHTDLLFFRETNQKHIDVILSNKQAKFIYDQLMISKQIIENSKPKIIIVCNSLARHFFGIEKNIEKDQGVWMNYDFEFNEELGTHVITNSDSKLKGVPVFFSSMLTGQRALDKGSLERLKWHIKFVLKKLGH